MRGLAALGLSFPTYNPTPNQISSWGLNNSVHFLAHCNGTFYHFGPWPVSLKTDRTVVLMLSNDMRHCFCACNASGIKTNMQVPDASYNPRTRRWDALRIGADSDCFVEAPFAPLAMMAGKAALGYAMGAASKSKNPSVQTAARSIRPQITERDVRRIVQETLAEEDAPLSARDQAWLWSSFGKAGPAPAYPKQVNPQSALRQQISDLQKQIAMLQLGAVAAAPAPTRGRRGGRGKKPVAATQPPPDAAAGADPVIANQASGALSRRRKQRLVRFLEGLPLATADEVLRVEPAMRPPNGAPAVHMRPVPHTTSHAILNRKGAALYNSGEEYVIDTGSPVTFHSCTELPPGKPCDYVAVGRGVPAVKASDGKTYWLHPFNLIGRDCLANPFDFLHGMDLRDSGCGMAMTTQPQGRLVKLARPVFVNGKPHQYADRRRTGDWLYVSGMVYRDVWPTSLTLELPGAPPGVVEFDFNREGRLFAYRGDEVVGPVVLFGGNVAARRHEFGPLAATQIEAYPISTVEELRELVPHLRRTVARACLKSPAAGHALATTPLAPLRQEHLPLYADGEDEDEAAPFDFEAAMRSFSSQLGGDSAARAQKWLLQSTDPASAVGFKPYPFGDLASYALGFKQPIDVEGISVVYTSGGTTKAVDYFAAMLLPTQFGIAKLGSSGTATYPTMCFDSQAGSFTSTGIPPVRSRKQPSRIQLSAGEVVNLTFFPSSCYANDTNSKYAMLATLKDYLGGDVALTDTNYPRARGLGVGFPLCATSAGALPYRLRSCLKGNYFDTSGTAGGFTVNIALNFLARDGSVQTVNSAASNLAAGYFANSTIVSPNVSAPILGDGCIMLSAVVTLTGLQPSFIVLDSFDVLVECLTDSFGAGVPYGYWNCQQLPGFAGVLGDGVVVGARMQTCALLTSNTTAVGYTSGNTTSGVIPGGDPGAVGFAPTVLDNLPNTQNRAFVDGSFVSHSQVSNAKRTRLIGAEFLPPLAVLEPTVFVLAEVPPLVNGHTSLRYVFAGVVDLITTNLALEVVNTTTDPALIDTIAQACSMPIICDNPRHRRRVARRAARALGILVRRLRL